jgi:hypothetical protein
MYCLDTAGWLLYKGVYNNLTDVLPKVSAPPASCTATAINLFALSETSQYHPNSTPLPAITAEPFWARVSSAPTFTLVATHDCLLCSCVRAFTTLLDVARRKFVKPKIIRSSRSSTLGGSLSDSPFAPPGTCCWAPALIIRNL